MAIKLRHPQLADLSTLSQLCLRSKAHWGYDAAFMKACEEELTLQDDALRLPMVVAEASDQIAGVAQLSREGADADLALLYVDPDYMGQGVGQRLFDWCVETAQSMQAENLLIEADPHAQAFYEHMGAKLIGDAPSGSIPGRRLPLLALALR